MPSCSITRPFLRPGVLGAIGALLGGWGVGSAAEPPVPVLTDIREIRALPTEQAGQGLPVIVRGVITRITPYELFIQNGPDAIFVNPQTGGHPELQLGDQVEVHGNTNAGHLTPTIRESAIKFLGHDRLPIPQVLRYGDLGTRRSDCQWVEVSGVVRAVEVKSWGGLTLGILMEGQLLRAEIREPAEQGAHRLLGSRVRLRGVISGSKTPQRKIVEPVLWGSYLPETFVVESPGPVDAFDAPLWAVDTLREQGRGSLSGELVRVSGQVTSQLEPDLVFIRDGKHGLEVRLQQPAHFAVGDRIEAVGFPEMGLVQPVLQSALAQRRSAGAPPPPVRLRAAQLLDFQHETELVEVEGELREISRHNHGVIMLLVDEGKAFQVDVLASRLDPAVDLPPVGSRVALIGINQIDRVTPPTIHQIVSPASARLRLRSHHEVRVLSRPPWWTPERLLAAISLLSLLALGALGWVWTLDRRVRAQTRVILGSVQKEAVLEERNRIAREFHDTLEQQLAGTTILLDAIDTILHQPQRARESLNTARAMLRHSLDEAQQAVGDLRSNDLIERDFGPLVEGAARERLHATGIPLEFQCDGAWPELDIMVKQHLLRIALEAVTNAAKHASPSRIKVSLRAGRDVVEVHVADDGCGFSVPGGARAGLGQFGLIGLQERAEKIGARLSIQSAPAQGTIVAVTLPLGAATI
jgi:signal transduction histidine kinase